jgi:hypothetical protein
MFARKPYQQPDPSDQADTGTIADALNDPAAQS